jgi:hypothetical protein
MRESPLGPSCPTVLKAGASAEWQHKYDECDMYEPFLLAQPPKPNFQIEYGSDIENCPILKTGQHMLVYSEDTLDTRKITRVCS